MSERTNGPSTPVDLAQELEDTKAKLRRSQEELQRFAYFLSHDFRAPLRHITSFSALLQDKLGDHENSDVLTWLEFMGEGAGLAQHLVDEVLLFSRAQRAEAEAGSTVFQEMLENLKAVVDAPKEGLTIDSQIEANVVLRMPYVHAAQVFAHLVQNAISFRKSNEPAQISLVCRSLGEDWEIEVRDSGGGIRTGDIERVFDAFYRSSESPRTSAGLGLSVARHLLSLYGGSIEIESEYGESTTVRVLLPSA